MREDHMTPPGVHDRQALASILTVARNWVRRHVPPGGVDPHATLAFFRFVRTDTAVRRLYLRAAGCETGFEVDHPGKDVVNPHIGRAVKLAMRAASATDPDGRDIIDQVEEGEFIQTYTRLAPRAGQRHGA